MMLEKRGAAIGKKITSPQMTLSLIIILQQEIPIPRGRRRTRRPSLANPKHLSPHLPLLRRLREHVPYSERDRPRSRDRNLVALP